MTVRRFGVVLAFIAGVAIGSLSLSGDRISAVVVAQGGEPVACKCAARATYVPSATTTSGGVWINNCVCGALNCAVTAFSLADKDNKSDLSCAK
jgi:hypothetical protein